MEKMMHRQFRQKGSFEKEINNKLTASQDKCLEGGGEYKLI